jgi:hypothetical protein
MSVIQQVAVQVGKDAQFRLVALGLAIAGLGAAWWLLGEPANRPSTSAVERVVLHESNSLDSTRRMRPVEPCSA